MTNTYLPDYILNKRKQNGRRLVLDLLKVMIKGLGVIVLSILVWIAILAPIVIDIFN